MRRVQMAHPYFPTEFCNEAGASLAPPESHKFYFCNFTPLVIITLLRPHSASPCPSPLLWREYLNLFSFPYSLFF